MIISGLTLVQEIFLNKDKRKIEQKETNINKNTPNIKQRFIDEKTLSTLRKYGIVYDESLEE